MKDLKPKEFIAGNGLLIFVGCLSVGAGYIFTGVLQFYMIGPSLLGTLSALLGFLFLREKISINVWIAIFIATIGIVIMAFGNTNKASLIGFIFGLASSMGFSVFSVTLRWRKETPKFTPVAFSGFFCFRMAI